MAETTDFQLISPERELISEPVEMVVIPGEEGHFGVLPQHMPLISGVKPGVIEVWKDGKVAEKIFVAGGYAEVTEKRCIVLAEEAVPVSELDRLSLESDLKNLKEDLVDAKDAEEKAKVAARIRIVEAMHEAVAL